MGSPFAVCSTLFDDNIKCAGFHLRFQRNGHMHGHLVAVKVGVEGSANQRVQLDCFAFDQDGFKGLNCQDGAG